MVTFKSFLIFSFIFVVLNLNFLSFAAVIPKGVSSILTNLKIPSQQDLFTDNNNNMELKSSNNIINSNEAIDASSFNNVEFKVTALELYKSTISDFSVNYQNDKTTAMLLSSKVIRNNTLQKLGIKGISFKLPIIGTTSKMVNQPSFLPIDIKSVFLFNLNKPILIDQNNLSGTIPFNIKGDYEIDDYNMLIPLNYLQDMKISSIFLEEFLSESSNQILYYNKEINFKSPVLITSINNQKYAITNKLKTKLSNLFFEIVSKNWLSTSNSINLLESSFCFINNNEMSTENNLCIKINDETESIKITPAFDENYKLNFNNIIAQSSKFKRDLFSFKYSNSSKIFDNVISDSFKIQVGNGQLTSNSNKFNLSNCKEETIVKPIAPLKGSLFQVKDDKASSPHVTSATLLSSSEKSFLEHDGDKNEKPSFQFESLQF